MNKPTQTKKSNEAMIVMTTDLDEFDNRIHDLIELEKECESLIKNIKNGNGEDSLRHITLRDACKELRKEIYRNAKSAALSRQHNNMKIEQIKSATIATSPKKQKDKANKPITHKRNQDVHQLSISDHHETIQSSKRLCPGKEKTFLDYPTRLSLMICKLFLVRYTEHIFLVRWN